MEHVETCLDMMTLSTFETRSGNLLTHDWACYDVIGRSKIRETYAEIMLKLMFNCLSCSYRLHIIIPLWH